MTASYRHTHCVGYYVTKYIHTRYVSVQLQQSLTPRRMCRVAKYSIIRSVEHSKLSTLGVSSGLHPWPQCSMLTFWASLEPATGGRPDCRRSPLVVYQVPCTKYDTYTPEHTPNGLAPPAKCPRKRSTSFETLFHHRGKAKVDTRTCLMS